ncbi:hypothetical protein QQF64_008469, partial [Cirrhinus molitorella]
LKKRITMAESSSKPTEASSGSMRHPPITLSEDLKCSICLDVFTDPVSTPCGHNFCKSCLNQCWNNIQTYKCPICKANFRKRPELKFNTALRSDVKLFKEKSGLSKPEILCDICDDKKMKALKMCLMCQSSYCDTHLEPHHRVPTLRKHKLIDPWANIEKYVCQKHNKELELFCRDDQTCVCFLCTVTNHRNHNTVAVEEESAERKPHLRKMQTDVQQMIQDRMKRIKDIKHLVKLQNETSEKEKADINELFTYLNCSIERCQSELLEMMEQKTKTAMKQAKVLIAELQQEITELKRRDTELEQLSHTEDHLHLLQIYPSLIRPPHTSSCSEISISDTQMSVETLRKALTELQETLDEKLSKTVLKRMQKHAVDVTLDPDTAYPKLILSDDGKQVTSEDIKHKLPDNPKRFDYCSCVLAKQGFSSDRFYFEVQVKGMAEWDLGVVRESSNRKGKITAIPEAGYWIVVLRKGNQYMASESSPVFLSLRVKPQVVGVFVDYEEGLVSFYDVESRSHIYSFTALSSSSGPLAEELKCSVCLDLFTDPVSTPCGHNFCKRCLNQCWNNSQTYKCPGCRETFGKRPDLKINTALRQVVQLIKDRSGQSKPEVLCDICDDIKMKALKMCLVCQSSYCETHLKPHYRVEKLKRHKLIDPENPGNYICETHGKPLELFCRDDQTCVCLLCGMKDHKNHNTVAVEEESGERKPHLKKMQTDVRQMIEDKMKRMQDIRHLKEVKNESSEKEKAESIELFTFLMRSIERCQFEMLEMMEQKQKAAEKQADELINDLEQEITELKRRDTELEQLSHTEDHLHLLQIYPSLIRPQATSSRTEISISDTQMSVETLRKALIQLQETLDEKLNNTVQKIMQHADSSVSDTESVHKTMQQYEEDLTLNPDTAVPVVSSVQKTMQQYAVDLTLDPDTAHPNLILFDRGKKVAYGDTERELPDNPESSTEEDAATCKYNL